MLEIEQLQKRFGALDALDGVSLRVAPGEMVGVIGPSGAGKSTLLRAINCLVRCSAGTIRHDGTDVTRLRGRALRGWRRRCAMIFQQFNLVPRLDVLTNVLIGRVSEQSTLRTLFKLSSAAERTLAVERLERVGLAGCALQRADTLSGGQQQRVAIARVLMQAPGIILADEPIASLDPGNAQRVMALLREVNAEHRITVLCTLHTLEAARAYCPRIVAMSAGRIVFDGAPSALDASRLRAIYGAVGDGVPPGGETLHAGAAPAAPAPRPALGCRLGEVR